MLVGTGIDLVEVERIAHSIERFGDRFLEPTRARRPCTFHVLEMGSP